MGSYSRTAALSPNRNHTIVSFSARCGCWILDSDGRAGTAPGSAAAAAAIVATMFVWCCFRRCLVRRRQTA